MRARLIALALTAALAAVIAVLAGPLGTRVGAWRLTIGLGLMAIGVVLAAAAILLAVLGGWLTGRWPAALTAVVIALVAAAVPVNQIVAGRGSPPIHDITTDSSDPPPFVAVLANRTGRGVSPPEYDGPDVAAQQRRAYPDIVPLELAVPPARAFEAAAAVARDLGWDVVAADGAAGRIEAIDTTFWFGFKDDVVIRVRESAAGSRVDIRSKSRVGRGDVGANARRIRTFRDALNRRIQP